LPPRTIFSCQRCGLQAPKWLGRCPECGAWGTLVEEPIAPASRTRGDAPPAVPVPWPEIPSSDGLRLSTTLPELDRVLGGGLVPGCVVLVGGEPGIGKSTLLLQFASGLAADGRVVLYVSGEESAVQMRLRGDRLGVAAESLLVLAETALESVLETAARTRPAALIVDSVQAVRCSDLASVPGSVGQVREAASRLTDLAKSSGTPVLLVGHATKDGSLAGPKTLEHLVDTVLQFEGDRQHVHRVLRALKNRFGPADELGVFTMTGSGLVGVPDPSGLFLSERPRGAPGSAILPTIEGSRPLLVEVQALVGEPVQGTPRRTTLGVDSNRAALILAVLQRRLGLQVAGRDLFVNIAGGLEVREPAADLAVAAALASSLSARPLPEGWTIMGEVGLTGEIRSVSRVDARLREAARLGFETAVLPAGSTSAPVPGGVRIVPVAHLAGALAALLPGVVEPAR
jgi:DNA repair protein RadA/Sms